MIYFGFNITNPWCNRFKNIWSWVYDTPFKHKFIELEVYKDNTIVSASIKLSTRQSHAGLTFDLGLLGHTIDVTFYDNRHWYEKEGRYYIYNEEEGLH